MNINRGTPNTISTPKYTKLFKSCFCFLISVLFPIIYAPFLSTLSFRIICFLPGTFSKFHTLSQVHTAFQNYLNSCLSSLYLNHVDSFQSAKLLIMFNPILSLSVWTSKYADNQYRLINRRYHIN